MPQKIDESFRYICRLWLRLISFFQMSIRSNMSSSSRLPSSFPEQLRSVLDSRTHTNVCPTDVAARLLTMPFFQKSKESLLRQESRAPKQANRFANLISNTPADAEGFRRFNNGGAGGQPSQWRPAYSSSADRRDLGHRHDGRHDSGSRHDGRHDGRHDSRHDGRTDDGFQVWSTRRQVSRVAAPVFTPSGPPPVLTPSSVAPTTVATLPVASEVRQEPEVSGLKFSSAAVKCTGETEDRILAKVKGKINKLGPMNYEATKTFMQQILDSDETEFLDEFMKFIFQKAATESTFCPLYAKLLHELADQFTHLRVVMTNLFRDYTAIFVEVETAPDVGTEDYKAFVKALERKKFRRGYSQFVAELVKLGEADLDAFSELVQQIVTVLEMSFKSSEKTLVCEEYIDCLAHMCTSAPKILSNASWSDGVKDRLAKITKIPRSEAPGLTNKGRFALMDLVDFANRGWK